MSRNTAISVFSCLFFTIIIVGVALFGSSFNVVELNRVALYRNKYSVAIEEGKLYMNGRYFTGLGGEFIDYPTTWQYLDFSNDTNAESATLNVKTSDASTVTLEFTIIYRIKYEFLHKLYQSYKKNYLKPMIQTAKDQITKVITTYKYEDLFTIRNKIQNEISQKIGSKFKSDFYCELTLLLLREIQLNDRVEQIITQSQIKRQEVITESLKNQIQNINAQIDVIQSDANIVINQNLADAQEQESKIIAESTAKGDALIRTAEGLALADYRNIQPYTEEQLVSIRAQAEKPEDYYRLGLTEEQLLRFLFIEKLIQMNNIKLMLDLPETSIYNVQ